MSNNALMSLLLVPLCLIIILYGLYEVEAVKKPKVVILHVHKEEIPFLKIDEDDWKDIAMQEVS